MSTLPTCPAWCADHRVTEFEDRTIVHHGVILFYKTLDCSDTPLFNLYASSTEDLPTHEYDFPEPGLALQVRDGTPSAVEPEDARRMAAALIRGAEIVEASRTATCVGCGRAVHPNDADGCIRCQIKANVERRQRLRSCESTR